MSADTNDQTPPGTNSQDGKGDAVSQTLAQFSETLKEMNAQMQATAQAVTEVARRAPMRQEPQEEENLFDPNQLLAKADKVFTQKLQSERAKDMMIYNLSQEYPEIQTDPKIRQAVLEAQRGISEGIRDTAEGYEMAVLKAVQKNGVIPKSRRQAVDEDASIAPRGGGSSAPRGKGGKVKLAPETLELARLMGRDTEDPEVIKRLEAAASRDTYNRYR